MYDSTMTVTVGLDVHARSIRLAAVRADELLEERTLPYDEEAVERLLRRWPAVRCCYEAGPTGFGLYRHLVELRDRLRGGRAGAGAAAAGRPRRRPTRAMRASWRGCSRAGCSSRSTSLRPSWRRPAISSARARTRGLIGCATGTGSRSSACAMDGCLPTSAWTVAAAQVARRAALRARGRADHLRQLPARGRPRRRPDRASSSRRSARSAEHGPWRAAGRTAALPARHRHPERARAGGRDRRLRSLPQRRGVHGLRRSRTLGALLRRAPPPGLDHQGRQRARPPVARRVSLARASAPDRRLRARPPPTRPRPRRDRARLALSAAAVLTAGSGWPAAASRTRRSSWPARASSPASSGRSQPTSPSGLSDQFIQPLDLEQRMRPTTRRTLESSMRHRPPVTRDFRPRQLPRIPVMPSRPANVSLIHRRCSGRSAAQDQEDNPSTEPHPLTFCSMSELVSE